MQHEVETLNKIVVERGAVLKVIFENDCTLCTGISFPLSSHRLDLELCYVGELPVDASRSN